MFMAFSCKLENWFYSFIIINPFKQQINLGRREMIMSQTKLRDFEVIKKVGEGAFGKVY